jgi:hypothetical protein
LAIPNALAAVDVARVTEEMRKKSARRRDEMQCCIGHFRKKSKDK